MINPDELSELLYNMREYYNHTHQVSDYKVTEYPEYIYDTIIHRVNKFRNYIEDATGKHATVSTNRKGGYDNPVREIFIVWRGSPRL